MNDKVKQVLYNRENGNLIIKDENKNILREINVDVKVCIELDMDSVLMHILKLLNLFTVLLRPHLQQFIDKMLAKKHEVGSNAIDKYINRLEQLKLLKKHRLNNYKYYMLTGAGYALATLGEKSRAIKHMDDTMMRTSIFFAQYYLDNDIDVSVDIVGSEVCKRIYENIDRHLNDDKGYSSYNNNLFTELRNIVNAHRICLGRKQTSAQFHEGIRNISYYTADCDTNGNPQKSAQISENKFNIEIFLKIMMIEVKNLSAIKDMDLSFETIRSLEKSYVKYTPKYAYERCLGWSKFNLGAEDSVYRQLKGKDLICYNSMQLKHYSGLSSIDKINNKKDYLSGLKNKGIYCLDFTSGVLDILILDTDRSKAWYVKKLVEIDRFYRQLMMDTSKLNMSIHIIVYAEEFRCVDLKTMLCEIIKSMQESFQKAKHAYDVYQRDSYIINDDRCLYFINPSILVKVNKSSLYLEKANRSIKNNYKVINHDLE